MALHSPLTRMARERSPRRRGDVRAASPHPAGGLDLVALQRTVGNQAVAGLLRRTLPLPPGHQASSPRQASPPRASSRPSASSVLQRIEDFATWKESYKGEEGKALQAWLQEAMREYKSWYLLITGNEITGQTTSVPDFVKGVHKRFVTAYGSASKEGAGGQKLRRDLGEIRQVLFDMQPLVQGDRLRQVSQELTVHNAPVFGAPEEVVHRIFSFLPLTSLVKVRATNRFLRYLAGTKIVFQMRHPQLSATVYVTLDDVNNQLMRGATLSGLHGSSVGDRMSLYGGITPRPKEKDRVYKTSQLGPGFYLTKGKGKSEHGYALSVAEERQKMTKTEAVVFRVFLRVEGVTSFEVPKEDWADMEHDIVPSKLEQLCEKPRLLTSSIVKNEHVEQIKVNPSLFEIIQILPPLEAMETEFEDVLRAYLENHPFEFGTIVYDKR